MNVAAEVLTFEGFGDRMLAELELASTPLREDTSLVDDLAFDSVLTFELLLVLEDWIGVLLPEALLGELRTMGDVYAVYETRTSHR